MKRTKLYTRMAALLLCLVMLGTLVGCQTGGTLEEKKTTAAENEELSTQSGEADATGSAEESTEAEPIVIDYPLEGVSGKITWFATGPMDLSEKYENVEDSPFHAGLEKMTGVDIEWIFTPVGGQNSLTWNLLQQEKELPYIVSGGGFNFNELIEAGKLVNLADYLPEYAPDYWAFINSDENIRKKLTTDDGGIYYFVTGRDERVATQSGAAIRQDWLDECGLEVPTTLAEWENVLTKFKEKYGAVMCGVKGVFNQLIPLASGTGAKGGIGFNFYVDEDGIVHCPEAEEEFFELIDLLADWHKKGLIDPDITSTNGKSVRSKALAETTGLVIGSAGFLNNVALDAAEAGNGADWVIMPYPTEAGEMVSYADYYENGGYYSATVITTSCPEDLLIAAIKLLNYGYSEEGIKYYNFGEEGVFHYVDENGEIQFTELIVGSEKSDPDFGLIPANEDGAPTYTTWHFAELRYEPMIVEALEMWAAQSEVGKYYMPSLTFTADEAIRRADLMSACSTYMKTYIQKVIFGQIEANWEEYLAELDRAGLQEILEIQQAVYDRKFKD